MAVFSNWAISRINYTLDASHQYAERATARFGFDDPTSGRDIIFCSKQLCAFAVAEQAALNFSIVAGEVLNNITATTPPAVQLASFATALIGEVAAIAIVTPLAWRAGSAIGSLFSGAALDTTRWIKAGIGYVSTRPRSHRSGLKLVELKE